MKSMMKKIIGVFSIFVVVGLVCAGATFAINEGKTLETSYEDPSNEFTGTLALPTASEETVFGTWHYAGETVVDAAGETDFVDDVTTTGTLELPTASEETVFGAWHYAGETVVDAAGETDFTKCP